MPPAPAPACLLCGGPARVRPFTDAADDPVSFLVCLTPPRGCGAYEVTGGFLLGAAAWRSDDPRFPRLPDYVRRENAQGRVPRLSDQTWRARVTSPGVGA
jgi:hypothetical protein